MGEKFEPDIYRDNLAEELKQAPKEERKEILEEAKEDPEYWKERNKKIEGRQPEEEPINDGLGVLIKKKTLYHGSVTPGIREFKESGDTTVGYGIYLTSMAKDAMGYAHQRMCTGRENPIIYESSIENLKLLDIRNDENLNKIIPEYRSILAAKSKEILEEYTFKGRSIPHMVDSRREFIKDAIKSIDAGKLKVSTIQSVTAHIDDIFTDYVKSLGYDGLVTIEGGEGSHKGNHDSYVVFNPEKVKIVREHKIKKEK